MMDKNFEVIIIGGSYAGLSAALSLGRSLRKTLVIDAGQACNRQTPSSHNFLTQDGSPPAEIAAIAKNQLTKYDSLHFYNGLALSAQKNKSGFDVKTENGEFFTAKKLVLAHGLKDIMPKIDGFAATWGISLIHCPYCHGYEVRNKKTAIIANGQRAFHLAALVNNLSADIKVLTNGPRNLNEQQVIQLSKQNIPIVEKEIVAVEQQNGQIQSILFADGSSEKFDCAYTSIPVQQSSTIASDLGCVLTDDGLIEVDQMQKTTIKGVFACGDNSSRMRSVATAVYTGSICGAMINNELTLENF
ncbi:NAD(P)/FAD-dependent oxidoreductase [Saprospira grandis]|uniref:Alkyl hydroperoxide reductase, F52a subunit n=1 Tax=Saprospira grandis (strain Lewin) TaxID=984262 RepID=H6L210_SAPGL|nr:NAD(P)/FAD-dependent oxidoreductase [Saprospira grandis]AFC23547.1 alkyl hydroperoxide reductase, F52a subunit [Saprospira grandis str. Lewin]